METPTAAGSERQPQPYLFAGNLRFDVAFRLREDTDDDDSSLEASPKASDSYGFEHGFCFDVKKPGQIDKADENESEFTACSQIEYISCLDSNCQTPRHSRRTLEINEGPLAFPANTDESCLSQLQMFDEPQPKKKFTFQLNLEPYIEEGPRPHFHQTQVIDP
eukprot:CAMPEP_0170492040 /NCGR_PEP_ID=MMETSP0208-20121228/11587_1 /TAXON_ID=197538 /ORGANISM="Strombidium inclinatum, Strain S3" /LENGTH=162 /DNA_ID=CAMNT_0010767725 /DNA_START=23 /DNA_END=511 /DNA_ORIENTATION=+